MTAAELRAAVERAAADPGRWSGHVTHDAGERTYALLHRDAEHELYVIGWMPSHDTGWHDHDDAAAAIAVVEGLVVEERLALGEPLSRTFGAGALVEVPPAAIHRVRHAGTGPATTLHAYSPPLQRVGTYELEGPDGTLLRHARPADVPLEPVG